MGWDKGGRYDTRSKRVNGRVVRECEGIGRRRYCSQVCRPYLRSRRCG